MKKLLSTLAVIGITITLLNAVGQQAKPQLNKTEHWKAYDAALKKGLPKTAITHLDPIIKETLAQKRYAEAIKAIGKKIALEGTIQGNKPQEKIRRLEAEIAKAPKEMVPVMDAILAGDRLDSELHRCKRSCEHQPVARSLGVSGRHNGG